MGLRNSFVSYLVRLGIGLIDILILGLALVYIYLAATPVEELGLVTMDAFFILLTVVILYIAVVGFVSLCLTYMREDNTMAKLVKSLISTIVVMALFNLLIFPIMWLMGYSLSADVQTVLIIASVIRLLMKIFLRRILGRFIV